MTEKKTRFRIPLSVLAFLVAAASLGWQIFDAVEKQREHVSGEVTLIRQPIPGRIDVVFTVRNPGLRPVFVESFELRACADRNSTAWKTLPWNSGPQQKVLEPGQSLTATITTKSLDELKEFLQQDNCFCFYFQSQAGASVQLWMDPKLKENIYGTLAFEQPHIILNYRVL